MFENKEDALKYIIKVKYSKTDAKGSAVLLPIKNEDYSYVLTAKHTFGEDEDERDKKYYDINISNIDEKKIELISPTKHIFTVLGVLDLDIDSKIDMVIIKVENDEHITKLLPLSIYNNSFNTNTLLAYGYPSLTSDGYVDYHDFKCEYSPIATNNKFKANLVDYTNIDENKDIQEDMQGLSGAGIFVENENKVYLAGIITDSSHGNYMVSIELRDILDEVNKELDVSIPIIKGQEKIESLEQDIKSSKETLALKALLKDMPIEKLKIKAYKYLPISYFSSLPDTIDGIIDRLLELSMLKEGCVPIIALFEKHPDKIVIDFVQYLKEVKFSHIKNFTCTENPEVEELSLLINISQQDGTDKFKVETWRYANSETHRIFNDILEIDLDNHIELNNFLDKVYDYLEEVRTIYTDNFSIELILPNERVYQSFKAWENSKEILMIRKYYYVHRLQSRFLQPDDNWKNKWKALEDERINIVNNTKFIEGFSYKNELSNANYKVVLKEKIENETLLFSDMEEFGIPILLSSLSKVCNVKEIKDFEFKGCQNKICNHIMENHDNEKSDIFFMVDNPNKIPNEFKNPEQNLYDW